MSLTDVGSSLARRTGENARLLVESQVVFLPKNSSFCPPVLNDRLAIRGIFLKGP